MLKRICKTKIIAMALVLMSLLALPLLTPATAAAAAIPAGCPGSAQAGPPAPGVCEAIPPGCPGSTQAGPPAPGQTCPYEGETEVQEDTICDATTPDDPYGFCTGEKEGQYQCGKGSTTMKTSINFGCKGENYKQGDPNAQLNPILDLLFALMRFLTMGIGVLAIGSVIVGGIQFTTSQGDPAATAKAIGRISSTVAALFLYLLTWALLNWIVPGGLFNG